MADLHGGLLLGNAFGQIVRLDLHAAAAAIVAELDESLARFDGLAHELRIDVMERLVAAHAEEEHRTVGKTLLDFLPLCSADARFDAMLVLRAQLNGQHLRLRAIGDDGGQIPVLGPEVSAKAELDLVAGRFRADGQPLSQRSGKYCGAAQADRVFKKFTAGRVEHGRILSRQSNQELLCSTLKSGASGDCRVGRA